MSTAFSQIVKAILDRLEESPAVCQNIYRARERSIPEQDPLAVNVQFEAAIPQPGVISGAPIDWHSRVSVDCYSRSVAESGDVSIDPLFSSVYERLASDPSLGQLVGDIGTPSIEAENTAEGKKTGWVRLTYIIQHRTYGSTLG